jgi:hypothetical protein
MRKLNKMKAFKIRCLRISEFVLESRGKVILILRHPVMTGSY